MMIRLLYPHSHQIRIFLNNWLTAYRSSHFYSTFKDGAGVLRHSKFSEFMGLAAQWRKLQKQQQKNEKKEVRSSLFMIAICLVGLSIGVIFVQNDAAIMLKGLLFSKQMQLSFIKSRQKREAINKEIMQQFQKFLQDYPYDYLSIIGLLNGYVRAGIISPQKISDSERLLNIYENILKRNHSAKSNLQFLQGVSSLIEDCYLQNRPISNQRLLWALLEGGTTKQIYITMRSLTANQHINEELKKSILSNMQLQMKNDAQYFAKIFQKIDEEEIPQISFKKSQASQWSAYIQTRLNLIS